MGRIRAVIDGGVVVATIRRRHRGGQPRWEAAIARRGIRVSQTYPTRALAEGWARSTEAAILSGAYRSPHDAEHLRVRDLLIRYRDEVAAASKSAKSRRTHIDQVIRCPLGALTLAAMTPQHVAQYRDSRLRQQARGGGSARRAQDRRISGQTVRHELGELRRAIDHATREWQLHLPHGNPVQQVRLPPQSRARDYRPSRDDLERIIAAARSSRSPEIADAIEISLETAMRRGELSRMAWEHVDFPRRVIHLPATKTDTPRDVPMTARVAEILMARPTRPLRGPVFGGPVFASHPNTYTQGIARLCKRLGIQGLSWHTLRHEAISRLVELGLADSKVAAISGHKTLQMLKRYTHLRATDLAGEIDSLRQANPLR